MALMINMYEQRRVERCEGAVVFSVLGEPWCEAAMLTSGLQGIVAEEGYNGGGLGEYILCD